MAASVAHQSRLSMAAAGTAIGSFTEAHEFVSESLRKTNEIISTQGITGSRSGKSERTRFGLDKVQGTISYIVSPLLLDVLLPRIQGTAEVADSFTLAETLISFDVLIERIARRFVYTTCYVNAATFKFTPGELVTLDLDIIGTGETVSATAFPTITTPVDVPYTCSDVVFTFVSSTRTVMACEVKYDNALNARFSNSTTATDIFPGDRIVTVTATTPYSSAETDLYAQTLLGTAATIAMTNGTVSCTWTLGKVQFPDSSPVVANRNGEIVLEMNGVARKTGTTMEVAVTNDSLV